MTGKFPLNFNWLFSKVENNTKIDDAFINTMQTVDIPHSNADFTLSNFNEKDYEIESIYINDFEIDIKNNHKYFIRFDGVAHFAKVYINDVFVGEHKGGYSSFELDMTDVIKVGKNKVLVEVDSRESLNIPPFGKKIDFLTFGGIYREVYIIEKPNNHILDLDIVSKDLLSDPKITLKPVVTGGNEIKVEIFYNDENVLTKVSKTNKDISLDLKPLLWDIETPNLYRIKLTLDNLDVYEITTGFREISFETNGFFLNGNHVKITGLNRHQIYPFVGYAMPKRAQEDDAILLKKTGNSVRTSHYPQSKHFIDKCDELGLLVFTETVGWQHIGDDEWQENYLKQAEEMVAQYKHHPSIILWGVRVNESGDNHKLYKASNKLVRSLDNRPTGGVRDRSHSEMLEDVYTYNDFIHNGTNPYVKPVDQIIKTDHPYLITEFMGHMFPTKVFDSPHKIIEHTLRYANILNAINREDRISGGFGWQFVDYYTHKEFGSGDKICHHGVYDMFRLPKPAAKVYQSQVATKPYLEPLNYMDIGDYNTGFIDTIYVASNCDSIKVYQDDRYVGEFYPNKETFDSLKHPLFTIDDLYGEAYKDENIEKNEFDRLVKIAKDVAIRGGLEKVLEEENPDWDDINKAWQLYGKYIANWGSDTFTYTLVGSLDGELITRKIGPYDSYTYHIKPDTKDLEIGDTYDVTRVVIEAVDNLENVRNYVFDSFMVEASGAIDIIGDKFISLIGGKRAVWIRTKTTGEGKLTFTNDRFKETISFMVTKK